MSFVKKLAGETVIYGLSSILPRVIYYIFITTYITYRFPDTFTYGIYNDLYAYSSVILVVLLCRLDTAYFRFGSKAEDRNPIFGSATLPVIGLSLIGTTILYLNAGPIASFLGYTGEGYYVKWFAFILGLDAIAAMFYARFRLDSKPYRFLFFKVANVVITLSIVFFFLEIAPRLGMDSLLEVNRKIDYVFIANLVGSASILILLIPDILRTKWQWNSQLLVKMMKYSAPLVIVGMAGQINQTFAVPLQKFFLGEGFRENLTQAGAYAGPMKIALLLNLFTVAFNYAAEPFFFNNVKEKNADQAYGQILHAFTVACGIAMMGIVCFQEVAILLIGESYRGPQEIIPILLFANLFLGMYYNISIWYKLSDKTLYGAAISIGGAFITLVLSITLLPKYGYIISAIASLCCYAFMVLAGYWLGQRHYPIYYPIKKLLGLLLLYIGAIGATIYVKSFSSNDYISLAIGMGFFVLFALVLFHWQKKYITSYLKSQ